MKKLIAALCCCALLTQTVAAQETMDKKSDHTKQEWSQKDGKKHGKKAGKKQYMGCSKLVGAYIYGTDGESIADINSITVDTKGNVHCAIVGVGGVAGAGETEIAVPWEVFECEFKNEDGEKTCRLKLPMTAEQLEKAPVLEKEEYAELYDQSWVETNSKFYGIEKMAKAPKAGTMMCVTDIAGLQLNGGKPMKLPTANMADKTYTKSNPDAQKTARSEDADESEEEMDLGTIEEVVIDLNGKKACYVVLGDDSGMLSEKHVLIPFENVKFMKKDDELCAETAATTQVIEAAPKVTPGEYQDLDKKGVRKKIKNSFMVK